MKSKSSKLLPLMCALLAIGVGASAWLFLRATSGLNPDVVSAADLDTARKQDAAEGGLSALPVPAPAANAALKDAALKKEPAARKAVATPAEVELAEALWVDGRVVYPEGTPVGEKVEVITTGRKFKTLPLYRATVEPGGHFRVAFAAGTKNGTIDIDAAHLFLHEPLPVKPADPKRPAELVLEPLLGGSLQGQLILPLGAQGLAADLVGKFVTSEGAAEDWSQTTHRRVAVDKDLRFELHGLSSKYAHTVTFNSDVVVKLNVPDIRVQPGATLPREFPLTQGAHVRGRVSDAAGEEPKLRTLSFVTLNGSRTAAQSNVPDIASGDSGDSVDVKVAADGSFDARGILPGKITANATGTQRLPAVLELGELRDGELREGIDLVLQLGGRIGGRVLWPDGTPADDARVQVRVMPELGADEQHFVSFSTDPISVRTNAKGEFQVSGLTPNKYSVAAGAKPAAATAQKQGSKGTVQPWRVSLVDVAIDTLDLKLKLLGGNSIHGIVLDDAGAPVPAFRIYANSNGNSHGAIASSASSSYSAADGHFDFSGLQDDVYTVNAGAAGHDDSDSAQISLPAESNSLTFVVTRRSSVSGLVLRPDGTPASRAEVSVMPAGDSRSSGDTSKTNLRGEFQFKSAPSGDVQVSAKLEGFAASEPLSTAVLPGQTLGNLRLVLRVGGRITGEVHASRAGEVLKARKIQASREGDYSRTAIETDATGQFAIEHLDPGEYTLTLEANEAQLQALSVGPKNTDRDWELREELEKKVTASVTDGVTTHVVFGAPTHASVALSGVVRHGGDPQASVRVRCQPVDDNSDKDIQFALSDASGRFELALNGPGNYRVQAEPRGANGPRIGRTVAVPAGGLRGVDLSLSGGRIAGSISGPVGVPFGGFTASLSYRSGPLRPSDVATGAAQSDSDTFDFQDLPAGTYLLEVQSSQNAPAPKPPPGTRNESTSLGHVQREITLGEGEQLTDLKIELHPAAHLTVHVVLADGSRPNGAWVDLRHANELTSLPSWKYCSGGDFEAGQLDPGVYDICAATQDQICAAPVRTELVAGQRAEVRVVVIPGGKLEFDVRDNRGESIAEMVKVYDGKNGRLLSESVSTVGSDGPLPPGECRVVATDSAGHRVEVRAEVVAGETTSVLLQLQ